MRLKSILSATLLIAVTLVSSFSSCSVKSNNNNQDTTKITKSFDIKDFKEIKCEGAAGIHFTVSDTFEVKAVGAKSSIEDLEIKLVGNQLVISNKEDHIVTININSSRNNYELYISAPTLEGVGIAGSMDFECNDTIVTNRMNIDIAGSGDILLKNLKADNTKIDIAGSGDININFIDSGSAAIDIAGSGDIVLSGKLKSLTKDIAGSGDVDTNKLVLDK